MELAKVTPSDLATAPLMIKAIKEPTYNHATQISESGFGPLELTYGGSRTYDYSGRPHDNDND